MGVLDQYDKGLLDDRDYDALDPDSRAAAEQAMLDRDRKEGRGKGRLAAALESDAAGAFGSLRARAYYCCFLRPAQAVLTTAPAPLQTRKRRLATTSASATASAGGALWTMARRRRPRRWCVRVSLRGIAAGTAGPWDARWL